MEEMFMQVFERRDWVMAQMRQQVASYSDSLACTLLAAGSRPPPWLLPHATATAVATQGNTLRKPSLDLANLISANGVHDALPETHQEVEPKALECSNITDCSEIVNQCQKCVPETIQAEVTTMHSMDKDPSSTNSPEVQHSDASSLLQEDTLNFVEANLHEIRDSVTSPLPEQETTHAAETDSLEGPSIVASPLLENDSLQSVRPNFVEGPDSVASPLPAKGVIHTAGTDYLTGPHPAVSLSLEKDVLCSDEANFLEGPYSVTSLLLEKEPRTCETGSPEERNPTSPVVEKATVHCAETRFLEGPHSMASLLLEKETGHASATTVLEGSYCIVSPQLEKDSLHTVEHTEILRKGSNFSDRSIDKISKILEHQSSECHMPALTCNEFSLQPAHLADTTSGALEVLGLAQENTLDDDCGRSSHPKENMLEDDCEHYSHSHLGLDAAFSRCSLAKSSNDDDHQNCIVSSGTKIMHNDSNSASATDAFLSAENEPSQMRSSLAKPSLEFERTGAAVNTHMVSAALFTSNESLQKEPVLDSINCHPEQSGHAQAKKMARSEAHDVSVRNNMHKSGTPEVLSSASFESARVLYTVERNSTTSAHKSFRSLRHEGTEQKIFYFGIAMEINADSRTAIYDKQTHSPRPSAQHLSRSSVSGNVVTSFKSDQSTDSHLDRSIASGIQVQGNSSFESVGVNCQSDDVLYCSSSTMSISSLDCQNDIYDQMKFSEGISGKPQPSARYFLSSSGSRKCTPLNSEGRSDATNCKSPVAHEVHASANASLERSMASLSDIICCNSPSMEVSSCSGSILSYNSVVPLLESYLDTVTNFSPRCSDILSGGGAHCIRKTKSCFKFPHSDVETVTVEDQVATLIDCVASGSGELILENYPSNTSSTTFTSYSLDQQSQQACASNELIKEKLSYDSNIDFDEKGIDDDPEVHPMSDGAIPWQNSDCDEIVQQRQSFGIPIQSNSPTIEERAFEALCDSTKFVNLSSSLSVKYKMDSMMEPLSSQYQSVAARLKKVMNRSSLDSVNTKQHDPGYDIDKLGISGKYSLELGGSFLMSNVLTYGSSNANSVQEDNEILLTPSVEKYSLEKLPGRTGSNSEFMGPIPELACFQIDEDISTTEENEKQDKLPRSPGKYYSSQGLTGIKPLKRVNSLYHSREKSASLSARYADVGGFDFTTKKSYSKEPDRHLHSRIDQVIKNPKKSHAPSIMKVGKMTQPLHGRASRTGILGSKNEMHRSEGTIEKGCKSSNIVTNMGSFIPLVKQKQPPTKACLKKDVRVKALEAAEVAKRHEEKKQKERGMRKAAAELERERLKQERERKQKQVEQKRKMDTDIVTRKRQREDDGKKEKERKKKCIEVAQKQQKQQVERIHAANGEKHACRKDSDDKELGNDLVGGLKHQLISDERTESVLRFIASESKNLKSAVADRRSESSELQVQKSLPDNVDKSYEMSPYKDSDEEDDDDLEHQEEARRRRKLIPSWARKETLDKILLSNQTLDPGEIFARKCSFNLSDVLALHIPQRRFN